MTATRRPRTPRKGTIGQAASMFAMAFAALAVAAPAGLLSNLGVLGDIVSIIGLFVTLAVFYIARGLYSRAGHAKESVLRERDMRSRKHMVDTVSLCSATVLVIKKSKKSHLVIGNMVMMRHIVTDLGLIMAQHGHVLSRRGLFLAEHAMTLALKAFKDGSACSHTALSVLDRNLLALTDHLLGIDDAQLVSRRASEAGFTGSAF